MYFVIHYSRASEMYTSVENKKYRGIQLNVHSNNKKIFWD